MRWTRRYAPLLAPAAIVLAGLRIHVAVWVRLQILHMQQGQRHPTLLPLCVRLRKVRQAASLWPAPRGPAVQSDLQLRVRRRLHRRPVQPGVLRPSRASGQAPGGVGLDPFPLQDPTNRTHRQSLPSYLRSSSPRSGFLLLSDAKTIPRALSRATFASPIPCCTSCSRSPIQLFTIPLDPPTILPCS